MTRIDVRPIKDVPWEQYDIFISSLGYEARSTFAPKKFGKKSERRVAVAFTDRLVGAYLENKDFYEKNEYEIITYNQDNFCERISSIVNSQIESASHQPDVLRLVIDISSMSRPIIASLCLCLSREASKIDIEVVFLYCPAKYTPPSDKQNVVSISEPVIPELAGWSMHPEMPPAALVGLGFEYDLALGAIEFLEPAAVWAFCPYGEDRKFEVALEENNEDFLNDTDRSRIVRYDVRNPYDCFIDLEALTYGLCSHMRPVIVPSGPKIFALLAVLVALIHSPNVVVWRVSGDQSSPADDREPSGTIIPINVLFRH